MTPRGAALGLTFHRSHLAVGQPVTALALFVSLSSVASALWLTPPGYDVMYPLLIFTACAVPSYLGLHLAYDLWGDAVNTASRMESHGERGRIQVTAPTGSRRAAGRPKARGFRLTRRVPATRSRWPRPPAAAGSAGTR
jgi:hypothetical protein